MKLIFITLLLFFQNPPTTPLGIWWHKEDNSKIEVFTRDNGLFGRLISTQNPEYRSEIIILKNFHFLNGKWKGEFYDLNYKRWVEASIIIVSEDFLAVNYKYGFIEKKYFMDKKTSD